MTLKNLEQDLEKDAVSLFDKIKAFVAKLVAKLKGTKPVTPVTPVVPPVATTTTTTTTTK